MWDFICRAYQITRFVYFSFIFFFLLHRLQYNRYFCLYRCWVRCMVLAFTRRVHATPIVARQGTSYFADTDLFQPVRNVKKRKIRMGDISKLVQRRNAIRTIL